MCHKTLSTRLQSKFDVIGAALEWVRSYFSNRSQKVFIKGVPSEKFDLRHGVL